MLIRNDCDKDLILELGEKTWTIPAKDVADVPDIVAKMYFGIGNVDLSTPYAKYVLLMRIKARNRWFDEKDFAKISLASPEDVKKK